jgi:hypothetical protein
MIPVQNLSTPARAILSLSSLAFFSFALSAVSLKFRRAFHSSVFSSIVSSISDISDVMSRISFCFDLYCTIAFFLSTSI